MTITLSPEVEADIRELLMAWEWREPGVVEVEAAAIGILKDGVALAISNAREAKAIRARARVGLLDHIPDARVFEEDPLIGGGRTQLTDAERAQRAVKPKGKP